MRLFIAINLPAREQQAIASATTALRAASPGVTWVAPDCLHVTMKFLGEQPSEAVERLRESLTPVAARYQPMRLEIGGVGAFPGFRSPRIVWLGIAHEPKLELLHHDLEVACEKIGYTLDGRAFRPHVTLGRVREDVRAPERDALVTHARAVRHHATVDARSIDIMQSELSRTGPRYTVLAELPLGTR